MNHERKDCVVILCMLLHRKDENHAISKTDCRGPMQSGETSTTIVEEKNISDPESCRAHSLASRYRQKQTHPSTLSSIMPSSSANKSKSSSATTTGNNYGSIPSGKGSAASFDEEHLRFLPETSATLTPRQKRTKCFLMSLPIIVAVLMMGGLAVMFNKDVFGPQQSVTTKTLEHDSTSSSSTSSKKSAASSTATSQPKHPADDSADSSTPSSSDTSSSSSSSTLSEDDPSACSQHKGCADLEGFCCPTTDGLTLECCN